MNKELNEIVKFLRTEIHESKHYAKCAIDEDNRDRRNYLTARLDAFREILEEIDELTNRGELSCGTYNSKRDVEV